MAHWDDFLAIPQRPFPTYIKVTGLRRPSVSTNDELRERVTETVTLEIQELLGDRMILPQLIYLDDLGANGYHAATGRGIAEFLAMGDGIRTPLQVRVTVEVVG